MPGNSYSLSRTAIVVSGEYQILMLHMWKTRSTRLSHLLLVIATQEVAGPALLFSHPQAMTPPPPSSPLRQLGPLYVNEAAGMFVTPSAWGLGFDLDQITSHPLK